jgi:phosphoglycerol transferase MdoB-like AlkP superfamily enzyme
MLRLHNPGLAGRAMRHRILLQTGLLTIIFVAIIGALKTVGDGSFLELNNYFVIAIAAASALALPWRASGIYLGAWLLISYTIRSLNEAKISLTEMPLTFLDVRIALSNPAGFLGAMKISWVGAVSTSGAIALVALSALWWRLSRLRWPDIRSSIVPRSVAVVTASLCATVSLTMFAKRLEAAIMGHDYATIANMPVGLRLIANKVGAVPFLILTARYDASMASPFRDLAVEVGAGPAQARGGLPTYMNPIKPPKRLPDIVVVLLESTFDLPRVFDVTPELHSDLFPNSALGQLQGELGVAAIGGGTWISKFEAITGIPSRLFGYAGYYTHVELAPYVKASLATHLKAKGYRTEALYPVEGWFYGARAAYAHYGFDAFHDGVELGIEKPWYAQDTNIAAKYIDVIKKSDSSAPLFIFALTMENHSPHPCTRFANEAEMPYRFVGKADARGTCELNEYINLSISKRTFTRRI